MALLLSIYSSSKFIARSNTTSHTFRDPVNKLTIPQPRPNYLRNSFRYGGAVLWNSLPDTLRQAESLRNFKSGRQEKGHPTTVFCKISVRRSKNWPAFTTLYNQFCEKSSRRIFYSLRRLKISRSVDDRSIHVQFSKLIYLIPYDFLKFNFSHMTPQVRI